MKVFAGKAVSCDGDMSLEFHVGLHLLPSHGACKCGVSGAEDDGVTSACVACGSLLQPERRHRNISNKHPRTLDYLIVARPCPISDMPDPHMRGLALTKSERIIVVALSYLFCGPLLWAYGKRTLAYLFTSSAERRDQIRQQEREERRRRILERLQ